jgi:hypothetical protein
MHASCASMQTTLTHSSAKRGPSAVHPWRRRFSRQKRRFVASPLSAAGAPSTLPSIEAGRNAMTNATRILILAVALAVNAAGVTALNAAMVNGAEEAVLANQEYDHVVVSSTRVPSDLAKSSCPGTKAL